MAAELTVERLVWTTYVEEKLAARGITPEIAEAVRSGSPQIYPDRKLRYGTYRMIGPCGEAFYAIIIRQRLLEPGVFDVVSGWPSTKALVRLYERNRGRPERNERDRDEKDDEEDGS